MKDSTQNMDDANGRKDGQGWDDPAFSWENMQDGIFGKIVEEDPDFFKEKRRRRVPIWFWFCAAALAGGGLVFTISSKMGNGSQVLTPNQPVPTKPTTQAEPAVAQAEGAIAKQNEQTATRATKAEINEQIARRATKEEINEQNSAKSGVQRHSNRAVKEVKVKNEVVVISNNSQAQTPITS
ncbi:MAG: hypothetical protein IT258_21720, partial [Saprospiraceae bacterium]|nr:hypothetical protein [Saprospiraceae bacterium]